MNIDIDTETLSRLRAALARIARELNVAAAGEGLSPTQASVLGLVVARGPVGLSELAELEGLNPTMLSRVVSALKGLELIERLSDPLDLRAVQVAATEAGRKVNRDMRATRTEVIAECLDRLPEESASSLIKLTPSLELLANELRTFNVDQ